MIDQPKNVSRIESGSRVLNVKPGDFFLIHREKFFSRLIQFGQRLRYTPEESYWNHCGIFTEPNGYISEALVKHGVTEGHISKYDDVEYIVVNVEASDEDRVKMMKFVKWAKGKPYGMSTDVGLAFWCAFGAKYSFSVDSTLICSSFVARTLERAGYIFSRDPQREMPADLARHFQVHKLV